MYLKFNLNKTVVTNWILFLFILTLSFTAIISELFRAPSTGHGDLDKYRALFHKKSFTDVKEVILKNRLGSFHLVKNNNQNSWHLKEPRTLPAKLESVDRVLNTFKDIKIKRIYSKDPINISNFSLAPPLISLTIFKKNQESVNISLGLIDSITNSTYLMTSEKDVIYQIDSLKESLEKLELLDFIDTKIISLKENQIASIKIFKGDKDKKNHQLSIRKANDKWKDSSGKELNPERVKDFLQNLTSLKSMAILDKVSKKLKEKLNKYLSKPLYSLEIQDNLKNTYSYLISPIIYNLPDLKLEKKQNFIIFASDRKYPYMFSKNHLSIFKVRQNTLGKIGFKKLFY